MRRFAAIAAVVVWTALALQLYLSMQTSVRHATGWLHGVWIYVAFFTILTNALAAGVLSLNALAADARLGRGARTPAAIAGIAANMTLVGVTYNLLLRNTWNPQGLQYVADVLLHDVAPLTCLAFWWIHATREAVRFRLVARWAAWPIVYFVYALVRGALTGFYPYPFLNVGQLGYPMVFGISLAMLAVFLLLIAAMVWLGNRRAAAAAAQERVQVV